MAIRSTNANRASKAYNPTARPAAGTGNFGRQNTDGPGGAPIDYGQRPPGSMSQKEQWDRRVDDYGMSPWYASGDQMPWSGPPGQEVGQRAPIFTPDAGDPRNAGYWRESSTPEEQAAADAAAKQRFADEKAWLMQDPAYAAAWQQYQSVKGKGGRDETNAMKAVLSAQRAAKEARTKQNYMDRYGMSEDTYDNRFNTAWPVPKSPLGTSTHDPNGMPSPRPAAVGPTGAPPASAMALPPSQNPMMQGYQAGGFMGGGPGVPTGGGWGPGGGMQPWATTGNPYAGRGSGETGYMYGGGMMPGPMMQNSEAGLFSGLFGGGQMGSGETGMMYPGGGMSGGVSPQLINMLMQMRGGGMGAMPMGGNMGMMGGGYNPYARLGMY